MIRYKRDIGEIWKDKNNWCVQFPKGIMGFKTKKIAEKWQNVLQKK